MNKALAYGLFLIFVFYSLLTYVETVKLVDPYMDEIFHIPQTQLFCRGMFTQWDPKITTLPGTYFISIAIDKLISLVLGVPSCTVDLLRLSNLVSSLIVLPLTLIVSSNLSILPALSAFPLLSFYNCLAYTDVWATSLILIAYLMVQKHSALISGLSGVVAGYAVFCRQTNIVWAGFIATSHLVSKWLSAERPSKDFSLESVVRSFTSLLKICFVSDISVTFSYGTVALAFVFFIFKNGGITVGDQGNHQAGLNLCQVFYFALFILFLSWPLWLSKNFVRNYFRFGFRSLSHFLLFLGQNIVIAIISIYFTHEHPFILADNRHYTFYLWKRLIYIPKFRPWSAALLSPVYHLGIYVVFCAAYPKVSIPKRAAFVVYVLATMATVIPTPLFEPRYFILPYAIWRLFVSEKLSLKNNRLVLEFVWYMLINAVVMYIFLYRPFYWPNDSGLQRFMW